MRYASRPQGWLEGEENENNKTSVDDDGEKLNPSHHAGRNVKWYSHCGEQSVGPSISQT